MESALSERGMGAAARAIGHAPVLWVCVPLLLGCALGARFEHADARLLAVGGVACACVSLWAAFSRSLRARLWGLSFFAGVALLGWSYYLWRYPPLPAEWQTLPARELDLSICVERTFAPARGRHSSVGGLGRIVRAGEVARELEGLSVCWRFYSDEIPLRGEVIRVRGVVEPVGREASGFQTYLRDNAVRMNLTRGRLLGVERGAGVLAQWLARGGAWCEQCLTRGFSPQVSNVFTAMLLGKSRALSSEQKENFALTGTLHLFAVSGLHVGLAGAALLWVCALMRLPRGARAWVVLPLLLVYVGMTGFPPSAVRAWTMIAFIWAGRLLGRPGGSVSGLALSAVCLLLYNPSYAGNAGFRLSYAVVAAILLYGAPLANALNARFVPYRDVPEQARTLWQRAARRLVSGAAAGFGVSLAAFLSSSPLCAETFGTFAIGGVALNLLLVPFASVIVSAGLLSMGCWLAGLPAFAVESANAVGVFFSQVCVRIVDFAHAFAPALFQTAHAPFGGFGVCAAVVFLAGLAVWRERLGGKSLSYFGAPIALWALLMAPCAFA